MAIWTPARIAELLRHAAILRAQLGHPDLDADPQLVAELHRQAAAERQGRDAGDDPNHDPTFDPMDDPARELYQPQQGPEV